MLEITNKLFIFLCCTGLYSIDLPDGLWILPVIISLTLGCLNSYFEKPYYHMLTFILYSILCIFQRDFLLFLPLIFYDVIGNKPRLIYFAMVIPIASNAQNLSAKTIFVILLLIVFAILLKLRTLTASKYKEDYFKLRDKTKEISTLLEAQNAALIANQDHEINAATLSERNRIAREIHDNLGHLLSRCLLQIGALIAINKDPAIKDNLNAIKDTLAQGMESVRKSVHNLHDESIDLHQQILGLIKEFSFCPVRLDYDISENPARKLKYSFISIVKEALSNIIKHSNATMVSVVLKEHPGLYQLIIQDNGTDIYYSADKGIGIKNISDRVAAFNGHVNINTEHGFKIFISVPKESLK